MFQVYTSPDRLLVYHMKNILENEGIATFIQNERLTGAVGDIPLIECWLELWIVNSAQRKQAELLVRRYAHVAIKGMAADWTCETCGEVHESQFTDCWQCGSSRYSSES